MWKNGYRLGVFLMGVSTAGAQSQSLTVYSELRRINPEGRIVKADQGGNAREILSPAMPRNGFLSFHLVVQAPQKERFTLYIGQNPERAVRVDVYREIYEKQGEEWIPDALELVKLPFDGMISEDRTTASFWVDLWVSGRGAPQRIKVEPQLYVQGRWTIYPMEVRIKAVVMPVSGSPHGASGAVAQSSDIALRGVLRSYLCGTSTHSPAGPLSIRRMIARNASQDMALARSLEPKLGRESITSAMLGALEAPDLKRWCSAPSFPAEAGPEWYLRIRDFLYRAEDPR